MERVQPNRVKWPTGWWFFLVLLLLLRLLVIPGEPWEQDEALFSAAAFDTNLAEHRPHPPGFPLWVLVAKIGAWLIGDATFALQSVSAIASVLTVHLLAKLFALGLGCTRFGIAAATLYALLPGVWFHSSRAFSTTPALMLTAVGLWLLVRPERPALYGAAVFMGAAILVRPVMAPIVLVIALAGSWPHRRRWGHLLGAGLMGGLIVAGGFVPLVVDAGGIEAFLAPLREHGQIHGGGLPTISWSFATLGPVKAVGGVIPALAALVLAVIGWWRFRTENRRTAYWWLIVTIVAAVWILGAHNRTYPRYSLPLLAICSVAFINGLRTVLPRVRHVAAAAWTLGFAASLWVAPALLLQTTAGFPGLSALDSAHEDPRSGAIIVDGGLSPFSDLLAVSGRGRLPTYWRPLISDQTIATDAIPGRWTYIWAEGTSHALVPAPMVRPQKFSAQAKPLAFLSQDRYLTCWAARHGAIVVDPARPHIEDDGTIVLGDPIELLFQSAPRGSSLGLWLEVLGSEATISVEILNRLRREHVFPPGTYPVALDLEPPRREDRDRPLRARIRADQSAGGTTRLKRAWIDRPSGEPLTRSITAHEQAESAEGLIYSTDLYWTEYFGTQPEGGRWTAQRATIWMPATGSAIVLRFCAPRPEVAHVVVSSNRLGLLREIEVGNDWQDLRIETPQRVGRIGIDIEATNPFVPALLIPGSTDERTLGVVVGEIRYE